MLDSFRFDDQELFFELNNDPKFGYAVEAGVAIINYTFEVLGFRYLMASMGEPIKDSERFALRLGMSFREKRIEDQKET